MFFPRNYFIGSLVVHILIIVSVALVSSHSRIIRKKFIVFGAHSRRNTEVVFKTFNYVQKNNATNIKISSGQQLKKTVKKTVKKENKASPKSTKKETKKPKAKEKKITQKAKLQKAKNKINNIVEKKKKKVVKKDQGSKPIEKAETPLQDVGQQQQKEIEKFHVDLSGQINKEMLVYQKRIQQEVQRLWRPPLGVPKGTVCTLLVEVGSDGKVTGAELVDRSKVLIYDLSVMKIAKKFVFHKTLWGKQFKIDFRQ